GPGGVFEWHGSVYGTYYASEWNAMSDEQHDEWFASVDYETVHEDAIAYHQEHNDYQTATIGDEVLVPEEAPADVPEDHAASTGNDTPADIPIAHVSDTMSFNEAFAAARQEVGPGGVFEWHGSVYGTYYASEWNAMSEEQHNEWHSSVDYQAVHEDNLAYHQDNGNISNEGFESTDVSAPEVEIINAGSIEIDENQTIDVALDSNGVFYIDVDQDGNIDAIAADLDGDGELDDNEIIDVSEEQVEMPIMETDYEDDLSMNDDYMNDADVSDFDA
ncbi:MAG: hypothetical protein HUJ98_09145, partial [Bacteroidaceae bacterium]|nr:hypothetical protein [Bacteroidaceae bacterium]